MNLQEITDKLNELNNWGIDGNFISKAFEFENFKEALDFVNKVGEIAEAQQHHPNISINYNRVKLTLTTHSEGGLTDKDFSLAKEIDKLTLPTG